MSIFFRSCITKGQELEQTKVVEEDIITSWRKIESLNAVPWWTNSDKCMIPLRLFFSWVHSWQPLSPATKCYQFVEPSCTYTGQTKIMLWPWTSRLQEHRRPEDNSHHHSTLHLLLINRPFSDTHKKTRWLSVFSLKGPDAQGALLIKG